MSARGLPGFLRRTFVDYDDDEEEEDTTTEGQSAGEDSENPIEEISAVSAMTTSSSTTNSRAAELSTDELSGGVSERRLGVDEPQTNIIAQPPPSSEAPTTKRPQEEQAPNNGSFHGEDDRSSHPETAEINGRVNDEKLSDSWQEIPNFPPSEPPQRRKSYRESQFDKVTGSNVVDMSELRKLGWNGFPSVHRAQGWKILLGYLPTNSARREQVLQRKRAEYKDAIAQHYDIDDDTRTVQEQETLRQVLVDVPRTQPGVPLFRNDRIRRILSRLLYIWAFRHPASSYVQGINDLATPLLVVFLADYYEGDDDVLEGHVMNHLSEQRLDDLEADVYWCLTNLLAGIQDHYTADQPGVQRMVMRLEELVNRIDADLCSHFKKTGIEFLQFSFKWMNCLLIREFPLKSVMRLWDTYISEINGFEDFHVYVCAAFLCQFSAQLQEMSFDELFGFMQDIPTADWGDVEIEMLLSQAYVLSTLFGGSNAHLTSTNNNHNNT